MIYKTEYAGTVIKYTIEKRKRKTISIQIDTNGDVKVVAPINVNEQYISDIVLKKGKWILETREKVIKKMNEKVIREIKDGSTFLFLGKEYPLQLIYDYSLKHMKVSFNESEGKFVIKANTEDKEKIKKELEKWYSSKTMEIVLKKIKKHENKFKDKVTEVKVKEQKRRWASCTYKNAILFNWRCSMAREDVVEYIVVHEMCHFDYKNHSKDFWNRVAEIMPDYREKHEYLRKNGMNFYI